MAPQNCGFDVQLAPPAGATITLLLGPRFASGLRAASGSLPYVLQGLPMGAGPLKSATAERTTVVNFFPNAVPKALRILLVTVTLSWLGLLVASTLTVLVPLLG